MKIQYKKATLSFKVKGKGKPVILLHGFLENLSMWDNLVNSLSISYQVICPDLLGHGKSESIGYVHTMEDMADALDAILNHLNVDKGVFIGHSMGGYIALAYAEKYQHKVGGLCLLNSTAEEDSKQRKENRDRAMTQVKVNAHRFIKVSIKNLFRPKNRVTYKNRIKEIQEEACQMSLKSIIAALEGMKVRPNRESILNRHKESSLIIAGKKDPVLNYDDLKQMAKRNGIKLISLPDGHMSHIENKSELSYFLKHYVENLNF
ncbi:MAG: alpha/beta hydrolase [Winogradskyella sp.]|nr:alpha/beta hydrolase [Winogradskyella sp.]